MKNDFFTDTFALQIWEKKYKGNASDVDSFYYRLAQLLSLGDEDLTHRFFKLMYDKRFSAGGRILAYGGRDDSKVSLINCTTHKIVDDSIEGIAKALETTMRASSRGQGIGVDISALRPKGSRVDNAALTSTGAISFMELINNAGNVIGQEGRRAAILFSIDVDHPDVWTEDGYDFLNVKSSSGLVENANISIKITDKFMEAVESGEDWELSYSGVSGGKEFTQSRKFPAWKLFQQIVRSAYHNAEPGLLFWDRAVEYSNSDQFGEEWDIVGVNACIHPDTLVTTKDGEITVSELSQREVVPYILTYNEHTGETEWDRPLWVKKTREDASVIKLILENNREVILTPDHKVLTENRGWIQAGELNEDDVLLGLS